jgi:hypothetical protein
MDPAVFTQDVEEVSITAPPQRSFAGAGSVIQISKPQVLTAPAATLAEFENTLTR